MTEKNVSHTKWMKRAIFLASLGKNTTSPNPRVGAVIIDKNGKLIAEGFERHIQIFLFLIFSMRKLSLKLPTFSIFVKFLKIYQVF